MAPLDQRVIDGAAAKCDGAAAALDRLNLRMARNHLFRALEAERSMMRAHWLREAADVLNAAGLARWAELVSAAACRIGGSDSEMRDLLAEVERACERREVAA
jgi:hypothetical protein